MAHGNDSWYTERQGGRRRRNRFLAGKSGYKEKTCLKTSSVEAPVDRLAARLLQVVVGPLEALGANERLIGLGRGKR